MRSRAAVFSRSCVLNARLLSDSNRICHFDRSICDAGSACPSDGRSRQTQTEKAPSVSGMPGDALATSGVASAGWPFERHLDSLNVEFYVDLRFWR
jgi:hypothetical protein